VRKMLASRWFWLGTSAFAGVSLFLAGAYWGPIADFCKTHGHALSAVGFVFAVVGFPLTIHAVLETQRIEREARMRVEGVVEEARGTVERAEQQNRQTLEKLRQLLVVKDLDAAIRHIEGLRVAGQDGQWRVALAHCSESVAGVISSLESIPPRPKEGVDLGDIRVNLEQIERAIYTTKLQRGAERGFTEEQHAAMTGAVSALRILLARLQSQALEG
jgi:hypothetical protein